MSIQTMDNLPLAKYKVLEAKIKKFRKSRKTRDDQNELYEALTNAGLSAEYADEYVNLEMED